MKLYESAYTYVPFIYLTITSAIVGSLYHAENEQLQLFRPYVVLSALLLNTLVHFYYKSTRLVQMSLHKHFWKTCTYAMYGILIVNIHELTFYNFHFEEPMYNILLSGLYILIVLVSTLYSCSDKTLLYINIYFLFFPIKREWQINLYIYVMYVTASIVIMYSKCTARSIIDKSIQRRPVLRFFVYLRVHDLYIFVGLVQLYLEYRRRYVPDNASISEIEKIIEEESEKALEENENV